MNKREEQANKNPYLLQRVVLSSVSDEIQLDENLEPPFVRIRGSNSNFIYIDLSSKSDPSINPASRICNIERGAPRINRIRVNYISFRLFSPNINPRNNVFVFTRISTGITYTITLAEQNSIGLARYTILVNAMNTAVGGPVFVLSTIASCPNTYSITDVGGSWYFSSTSIGARNGRYLWGMNTTNTGLASAGVGQIFTYFTENYTRYIDISSNELTQYAKLDPSGYDLSDQVLYRYNITSTNFGDYEFAVTTDTANINFDRSRSLQTIDITLTDEFSQLLYIPRSAWGCFSFSITFIGEM
jgi:hypothetical protein